MRGLFIGVIAGLWATSAAAQQTLMPMPADLRAAYCGRELTLQLQTLHDFIKIIRENSPSLGPIDTFDQQLRDTDAKRVRILAYLTPRMPYLSLDGLLLAAKQADTDTARVIAATTAAQCENDLSTVSVCLERATPADVTQARRACDDLSWLPF